jgi:cellulose synthase/poly-beta-1,6-N-acetylglucosamine synthase-like glycosyltransferase
MTHVIIASPVSYKIANGQELFTAPDWLEAINQQDYPDLSVYLLLNDLKQEMVQELSQIALPDHIIDIIDTEYGSPDERGKRRKTDGQYERFATLRNMVLDYVLSTDADYYVSIDSDIVVHPDLVSRLVAQMEARPEYGMIGAIVNNTRRRDMKRKYPRAIYNFGKKLDKINKGSQIRMKPLCKFKRYEFIDVDYTGACMILNMKMLRENPEVRWGPHRQGEDLYMCERIDEAGYKIGVDTSIVTLHLMDETIGAEDREAFDKGEFI